MVFVYPPITNLVSENLVSAVISSERVDPEIPAYALWKLSVALRPFSASTYLTNIISGLYAFKREELGKFLPAIQISLLSTYIFWNSASSKPPVNSKVASHSLTPVAESFATKATVLSDISCVLPQI